MKLGGPKLKQAKQWDVPSNKANADRFAAHVPPIIEQIKASGATSLCALLPRRSTRAALRRLAAASGRQCK